MNYVPLPITITHHSSHMNNGQRLSPLSSCHSSVIFTIFAALNSKKMVGLLTEKTHDESRQGEAYAPAVTEPAPYAKRFYIESYGCQMNFADSEVVASILNSN